MPLLNRIEHIGLAVRDLEAAIDHYRTVWGLALEKREVLEEEGIEEAMFRLGDSHLQLVAPLSEESVIGRFLARRGEGIHHIAYEVSDIEDALERLRRSGAELVDEVPRLAGRGMKVAFVHPKGNGGVLAELVQAPARAAQAREARGAP